MPNGTLCGKAAVQMLLAEEGGQDLEQVQQEMVQNGDLPRSYLVTDARLESARKLPTVAVQEEEWAAWKQNPDAKF